MILFLGLLSLVITPTLAGPAEDTARLGSYYTDIAIYRSGSGNNVVSVGLGDPIQDVNLTLCTSTLDMTGWKLINSDERRVYPSRFGGL
jgi:hypothetical protein